MNLCEVQHDERRDREAAALRVARQSLSPRVLPCTDTGSRRVRIPGPGGVVTTRWVCPLHEGEINAALAASPPPVKPFSVPEIVRDRPNHRPSTAPPEDSPMSPPRVPTTDCALPGCTRLATHGRFCSRDNTRRNRLRLPPDVEGAVLAAAWAAHSRREMAPAPAPALVVAPAVTSPEEPVTGQAAMSNLDQALGELRVLLDMDGYSPAAIVQRAATELRLAKEGVPNDPVRALVVRCGLPATATGDELVESYATLDRGLVAKTAMCAELERQLGAKESSLVAQCARISAHRDLLERELAHHLGLNELTVHAWLTGGGTPHLTNLRDAARHDANVELRAHNIALLNELAYQTGHDAADIEKWLDTPGASHLLNNRVGELSQDLADARCRLEVAEKAVAAWRAASSAPAIAAPSTIDISLPGGLRVLIQPVGASS